MIFLTALETRSEDDLTISFVKAKLHEECNRICSSDFYTEMAIKYSEKFTSVNSNPVDSYISARKKEILKREAENIWNWKRKKTENASSMQVT